MLKKSLLVVSCFLVMGCGKKAEEKAAQPAPMAETPMAEPPMAEPPKPEPPKVEAPKEEPKAEEVKLPVEAVALEVNGTVEVRKAGAENFAPLAVNAELAVGDHIRVSGEKAFLKLRMWDDSIVTLGTGAEAVINPGADVANSSPSITLISGTSNLQVEPRAKDQSVFMVYTPAAILSVLGTEFDVGVADSGSVKLGVADGLVQVISQDGKSLGEVPQGKVVVIQLEGEQVKATPPAPYDSEKEDWEKWYEAERQAAQARIDLLTKATNNRLEELKKQMEALEKGIAELEAKRAELEKKAEEAAAKNDAKAYETEAAPLVEVLDENSAAALENQRVVALTIANVNMLRRLQALVKAGVVKPTPEQQKVIDEVATSTEEALPALEDSTVEVIRRRYKRDEVWRPVYVRHHPRGREYAVQAKIELPEFYVKLPKVEVKPKVIKPKFVPVVPIAVGPYKGKPRTEIIVRPLTPGWHVARPYAPADPVRVERAKRIRERMERIRVPAPIVVEYPRPRHRRGSNVNVTAPGVNVEVMGPSVEIMGPGVNVDIMGPGVEIMGPGIGIMGPVVVPPPVVGPMVPGMVPGVDVAPGPGPRVRPGVPPVPPEPPMARHKRDM